MKLAEIVGSVITSVVIALVVILFTACSVVGPGESGIRVTLGSVSEDAKPPGVYAWFPFVMGMAKMDMQLQKSEIESSAATKDMQELSAHVAVNWRIDPMKTVQIYKTIGYESEVLNRVINPAVNEVMKAAGAKRNAEEVLTQRMALKQDIDDGLKDRLAKHGVILDDVSIVNLTFSQEFSKAIEQKQIAEQQAKQAEYAAKQATQEAKADVERAKGQAESQKLIQSSLTASVLQQRAIEKWDGKFPQYMSGSLPFLNLLSK